MMIDNFMRSTGFMIVRWLFCFLLTGCAGRLASAEPISLGASLGMIFPSDRLSERADFLGSFLLPAPSVGVHARWGGSGGSDLGWEGSVEMAIFESDDEARLRMVYVPIQIGRTWEVADVQGVALRTRVSGGLAFASTNIGATRSLTLGIVTLGAQLVRPIRDLTVAIDFDAGLHLGGAFVRGYEAQVGAGPTANSRPRDVLPVFKLRLTVFTR